VVSNVTQEEVVSRTITKVARRVHEKHRQYVELEDLTQEGYVWVMQHESTLIDLISEDDSIRHRNTESFMYGRLLGIMHNYAMRQRYLKDGTRPGDYHFYTAQQVEDLITDVLDGHRSQQSTSDLSHTRSARQPSEGWEYEATIADISAAVAKLSIADRVYLNERYAQGGTPTEVMALTRQVSQRAVQQRLARIMGRIVRELGGPNPNARRQARSNASSQVNTRRQEEGE
jgi:RNA polymerase sigma factor (sigma-70 family)